MPPQVPNPLDTLSKDYVVIGTRRVRALHLWTVVGLILIGLIVGIISVANHRGQFSASQAAGATITATSCNQADVQNAINLAVDGDTVIVPAGNCTWSSAISLTKSLSLTGMGTSSTIITDANQQYQSPINISLSGLQSVLISGFKFNRPYSPDHWSPIINFRTSGTAFSRIHDNWFYDIGGRGIQSGSPYLLVDSNTFTCVTAWCADIIVTGDQSGNHPMDYGGPSFTFIENNLFDYSLITSGGERDGAVDCKDKGRFVFRYNKVVGTRVFNHGFDSTVSCMAFEIYNNNFTDNGPDYLNGFFVQLRGGTGLIYNNTMGGSEILYNAPIVATNYRSCSGNAQISNSKFCDGTQYGVCSTMPQGVWVSCRSDADCTTAGAGTCGIKWCSVSRDVQCRTNSDCPSSESCTGYTDGAGANGYACRDQVGIGPNQQSYPLYAWNNTATGNIATRYGANITPVVYDNGGGTCYTTSQIQLNRDYCTHDPSTACGSVAGWTYTPYIYPHPLTLGGTVTPPPPPPSTPLCGNGVVETGEQCDLGSGNGACPSLCSSTCTTNVCTAPSTNKFIIGDRVQTTSKLNVRLNPGGGKPLGSQQKGAKGTVTLGPQTSGTNIWYKIDYDTGVDGWSVQDYLVKIPVAITQPPPSQTASAVTAVAAPPAPGWLQKLALWLVNLGEMIFGIFLR